MPLNFDELLKARRFEFYAFDYTGGSGTHAFLERLEDAIAFARGLRLMVGENRVDVFHTSPPGQLPYESRYIGNWSSKGWQSV